MTEASADFSRGLGPAERLGVFIPDSEVAGDCVLELADGIEAAAPDGLAGDEGEPALDEVQPGGAGGRKVDVEPGMGGEPVLDGGMLVRAVVVADQMDLPTRVGAPDRFEEGDELDVRVTRVATTVDSARRHLERGEEAGGAVADVVVGAPFGTAGPHGQQGLRAVEGLDLALLIDAEHQRPLRRIE